jgi:hypothetical protein
LLTDIPRSTGPLLGDPIECPIACTCKDTYGYGTYNKNNLTGWAFYYQDPNTKEYTLDKNGHRSINTIDGCVLGEPTTTGKSLKRFQLPLPDPVCIINENPIPDVTVIEVVAPDVPPAKLPGGWGQYLCKQ